MSTSCVSHHTIELPTSVSFEEMVVNLERPDCGTWWLDSNGRDPVSSRFSFAGNQPYAWLESRGKCHELRVVRQVRPDLELGRRYFHGDPIDVLRSLLPRTEFIGMESVPFIGGAIGVFGYEISEAWESTGLSRRGTERQPDQTFAFIDRLLIKEHQYGRITALGLGFGKNEASAQEQANKAANDISDLAMTTRNWSRETLDDRPPILASLKPSVNEHQYKAAVAEVGALIAEGKVYQVCLTQSLRADFEGDPFGLYLNLRKANPAPFSSYLDLPRLTIMSTSPESFLRVDAQGNISSSPIKGTRRRPGNPNDDLEESFKLGRSEKDRAENLMIVDLVRNDLGRVCKPGSVDVPSLWRVEAHEEIFHLVSTITGRLRAGCDALEAVRASMPPGSMTGAPKLAAVKIARDLEVDGRGYYAGALGYIDIRGGLDLAVVIRTLFLEDGHIKLHSGGGVVADSTPEGEWRELWDKLVALRRGLDV